MNDVFLILGLLWDISRPHDHLTIEEKLFEEIPEVKTGSLMQRIYDAQNFLLDKMSDNQRVTINERYSKRELKSRLKKVKFVVKYKLECQC